MNQNEVSLGVRTVKDRNCLRRYFRWAGLMILLLWGLNAVTGFAQETGQIKTREGIPINFTYKSWEILNYQQPDETHLISGNPAWATVEMEQATIRLQANFLAYYNAGAIIEATDGIIISDGTLTIDANHGEYDIKQSQARFLKGVQWESMAGGRTSSGSMDYIFVDVGDGGVENIRMGGKAGQPSKMNLSGDPETFGAMLPGGKKEESAPEKVEQPKDEAAAAGESIVPKVEDRVTSGLAP
jgi:hypothetical protein